MRKLTLQELLNMGVDKEKAEEIIAAQEQPRSKKLKYEAFLTEDELTALQTAFPDIEFTRPSYAKTQFDLDNDN